MRNTRNYLVVHSVVDGPIVPPTPPTSPDPVTYEVILPNGAGYTAAFVAGSSSPAVAGSVVNFTVVPEAGYEVYVVTDGHNVFTAVNGVYTINGIAANTTIKAEAELIPAPVTHTVTLPTGIGYTTAFVAGSSSPALEGSVVNFTVTPEVTHTITSVTNKTNGNTLMTPVNGVYTINGIAADTAIEVVATVIAAPPTPVTHTVEFIGDTGYAAAAFVAGSSSPAVAGSDVNFTVVATAGYEITSVGDGTNTLTPVNGVYTINAIAANTIIEIKAVLIPAPVTYTVKLTDGTGYTTAFVAGSSSPAVAGSDVNFTVVATEGYEITSVSDGTNTLTPVNGVYTINGIAADTAIEVVATVIAAPVAGFDYKAKGDDPLSIEFTNTSTDAVFYSWNFADGTNSISANLTHTYAAAGTYTVILTAVNIAGDSDTETKTITVS